MNVESNERMKTNVLKKKINECTTTKGQEMGTAKSYMYNSPSIPAATAASSCQGGRTPLSTLYGFLMPQFRSFKGSSMVWENNPPNRDLQREQDLALGRLAFPDSANGEEASLL